MELFPTLGQLLLPNLNLTTIIGLVILGLVLLDIILFRYAFTTTLGKVFRQPPLFLSGLFILAGVTLIWGVSILQDYLSSVGGVVIFFGLLIVAFVGLILFWKK